MDSLPEHARIVVSCLGKMPVNAGLRMVVGIAGPPGSGKSTLAAHVADVLNARQPGCAALVPMDGFHLDNAELDQLGLRAVKGAPQTFDTAGFVDLLRRARQAGSVIWYPVFDRSQDRALPNAAEINERVEILVVEGNYLLLPEGAWSEVGALLDFSVMLRPSLETLEARLIERWTDLGLAPEAARARALGNDLPNAQLVLANSASADLYLPQKNREHEKMSG